MYDAFGNADEEIFSVLPGYELRMKVFRDPATAKWHAVGLVRGPSGASAQFESEADESFLMQAYQLAQEAAGRMAQQAARMRTYRAAQIGCEECEAKKAQGLPEGECCAAISGVQFSGGCESGTCGLSGPDAFGVITRQAPTTTRTLTIDRRVAHPVVRDGFRRRVSEVIVPGGGGFGFGGFPFFGGGFPFWPYGYPGYGYGYPYFTPPPFMGLPFLPPGAGGREPVAAAPQAQLCIVRSDVGLRVRLTPSIRAKEVARLGAGDEVEVLERTSTGWARIQSESAEGWVVDQALECPGGPFLVPGYGGALGPGGGAYGGGAYGGGGYSAISGAPPAPMGGAVPALRLGRTRAALVPGGYF